MSPRLTSQEISIILRLIAPIPRGAAAQNCSQSTINAALFRRRADGVA
jgi:hypothetical protein